jgi:hypothetical protein
MEWPEAIMYSVFAICACIVYGAMVTNKWPWEK